MARRRLSCRATVLASAVVLLAGVSVYAATEYTTRSGIGTWVDPDTPSDRQLYTSSRGRQWELVMSDEFNTPGRDFRPGKDHLWVSLEKPDGVNGATETYAHNMTSTDCDADNGTCYFYIKIVDEHQYIKVYNMYVDPPTFVTAEFFYRSAMVQSWNKFCFQGGMLEVRAQLPGAVSNKSANPDLAGGPSARVQSTRFYPTWPGIWMMGNLGRAIFSGSTNRMWPFSYNRCDPDVFDSTNQRISACDANPGFGLNPNQGRGAPEIDLLEGGASLISSSLQIGPGMALDFRPMYVDTSIDPSYCIYSATCKTPGANQPGVPTALYNKRGHKSWYQGLRYQSNPFCKPDASEKQSYETVIRTINSTAGVVENSCNITTCAASRDAYADLGLVDGKGSDHWGINYNGTCFPLMNVYTGSYLCDPDNQDKRCAFPRPDSRPPTNAMSSFHYQMDAISANWPLHLAAYTEYVVYQLEWVTGENGYVRWMLEGNPLFEVPAEAITKAPQDSNHTNPQKIMLEEPMYLIMNVALSTSWGATPPNPGKECRGDGTDAVANAICGDFPMHMKVDYIRLYQDRGADLDANNYMQLGCDPASHPTKKWIDGHLNEYEDDDNLSIDVAGGAMCTKDDDCTVLPTGDLAYARLVTGSCVHKRCACKDGDSWGGPRCTTVIDQSTTAATGIKKMEGYGPPFVAAVALAGVVVLLTGVFVTIGSANQRAMDKSVKVMMVKRAENAPSPSAGVRGSRGGPAKVDYSRNFV